MSCLACGSENVTIQGEVISHAIENGEVVHKILHAVECLDCATVNNLPPESPAPEVPQVSTRLDALELRVEALEELATEAPAPVPEEPIPRPES